MPTNVNPDPHAEGFQFQPTNKVTAIIDDPDDVSSAIQCLKVAGLADEDLSVFVAKDGLAKLDLHGERHGVLGRIARTADSLTSNQQANQETEDALKAGRIYITVAIDGSDEQKTAVEHVLKAHHANHVHFYGRWTVEPS
jgi:hypothetical protein